MEHILYWLWLTGALGLQSGKLLPIIESMGGIESFYKAEKYPPFNELTTKVTKRLNNKSLEWAKRIYALCEKEEIDIITFDSEGYPSVLKHIALPPTVLYAKGIIPDWDNLLMISVVGTRRATDYGMNITYNLCNELAAKGVTIVSGLAVGIDSQATKSAINAGAYSIALCGCGIDINYPKSNKALKEVLIKNGLLLSEYPPRTLPNKWTFPPRNRIIAGLSKGVLVTEAPKHSGALITANRALEENRDVFAVPGKIDDVNFEGINDLIKDGAKPVFSADDILIEYAHYIEYLVPPEKPKQEIIFKDEKKSTIRAKKAPTKSEIIDKTKFKEITKTGTEAEILRLLTESDMHIDELMRKINVPANSFNTAILLLEMGKDIKRLPGNIFRREK